MFSLAPYASLDGAMKEVPTWRETPCIVVVPLCNMNINLQIKHGAFNRALRVHLCQLWIDRSQFEYHVVRFLLWLAYFGCVFVLFLMALAVM